MQIERFTTEPPLPKQDRVTLFITELGATMSKCEPGVARGGLWGNTRLCRMTTWIMFVLAHRLQRARTRLSLIRIWSRRIRVLLGEPLRVWIPLAPEIDGVPQSEWIRAYSEDTELRLGEKKWIDRLDLEAWHQGWVSGAKWGRHNTSADSSPATLTNSSSQSLS